MWLAITLLIRPALTSLPIPLPGIAVSLAMTVRLRFPCCGSLNKWTDIYFACGVIRLSATRTKAKRKFDVPITTLLEAILMEASEGGHEEYVFPSYTKGGGS